MSHRLIFTNNTKLNNTNYISGSGVGAVSASSRAALKRRSNVNATTGERCCDKSQSNNLLESNNLPPSDNIYFVVRFDADINTQNYMEFAEIQINTQSGVNIALGKSVTSYSEYVGDGQLINGIPDLARPPTRVTDGDISFSFNWTKVHTSGTISASNTRASQYLEISLGLFNVSDPIASVTTHLGEKDRTKNLEFLFIRNPYLNYFSNNTPNNATIIPDSQSFKTLTTLFINPTGYPIPITSFT